MSSAGLGAWSNVPAFDSGLDLRAFANRAFAGAVPHGFVDAEYGAAGRQLGKEKKLTSKHSIP